MHVNILTTETPRLIKPVSAQSYQITIEGVDTRIGLQFRPIERRRIAEIFIFQKFLSLENQRDAGRRKDQRRAERRPFAREPASRIPRQISSGTR
jgi:hypothetical protein